MSTVSLRDRRLSLSLEGLATALIYGLTLLSSGLAAVAGVVTLLVGMLQDVLP